MTDTIVTLKVNDVNRLKHVEFPEGKFEEELDEFNHAFALFVATGRRSRLEDALFELADMISVCVSNALHDKENESEGDTIRISIRNMAETLGVPKDIVCNTVGSFVHMKGQAVAHSNALLAGYNMTKDNK